MSNFIEVTPFMHVGDLERALAFFTGILGFDVHGPADKEYGQRQLLVLAPEGKLIAFGQDIRRK